MTNDELRMTNVINIIKNYLSTWWTVIVRPIYFYTKLKEENWQEDSLTFFLATVWLLSAVATATVFVIQYIPIGGTLVDGISGFKFIIILPVLITLAAVFFAITLLILGGIFVSVFFVMLFFVGVLLHYTYLCLGGRGTLNRIMQSLFYSSAVFLGGILIFLLMIFAGSGGLSFGLFRVGYNVFYFFMLLYVYGIWAIAGRKVYGVSKWKAFIGALIPIILLLIFGVLFDKIALLKIQPWIT